MAIQKMAVTDIDQGVLDEIEAYVAKSEPGKTTETFINEKLARTVTELKQRDRQDRAERILVAVYAADDAKLAQVEALLGL